MIISNDMEVPIVIKCWYPERPRRVLSGRRLRRLFLQGDGLRIHVRHVDTAPDRQAEPDAVQHRRHGRGLVRFHFLLMVMKRIGSLMTNARQENKSFKSWFFDQRCFIYFLVSFIWSRHRGASIRTSAIISDFLTPSPPCLQIHATSLTKVAYYVCF